MFHLAFIQVVSTWTEDRLDKHPDFSVSIRPQGALTLNWDLGGDWEV